MRPSTPPISGVLVLVSYVLQVAMGDGPPQPRPAAELFDAFISSSTCRAALWSFSQLCERLQLDRQAAERPLYRSIRCCLRYWRADALWAKLERRAARQEYQQGGACRNTTVRGLTRERVHLLRFCWSRWVLMGCPVSDWLVCGHRGGAMWSQDGG